MTPQPITITVNGTGRAKLCACVGCDPLTVIVIGWSDYVR
jgi:hypothetical protein